MSIPYEKKLDNSFALMREGYLFISNRINKYNSNIFKTRLMAQEVICMRGKEAAELLCDKERFQRYNAIPKRIQKTLFGQNAIQTLDSNAHIHRKNLFLSLLTPENDKRIADLTLEQWRQSASKWEGVEEIELFAEAKNILCWVSCRWAGIPLQKSDLKEIANNFYAMIDAFGGLGPRYWKGKYARGKIEHWIGQIIDDTRAGKLKPDRSSALYAMSFYKEADGVQLDTHMAAIELINIIRPIIAVATFITFSALALYQYPQYKEKLRTDNNYYELYVQEVRRYFPLTPFLGAKAKKDFIWYQCEFKKDMIVLLDVYGMNHDPKIWENPNKFNPERFMNWRDNLYDFIPQGGGNSATGHRCPGEGVTKEIMKASLNFLVNMIDYDVPEQDLSFSLSRMPTLPKDKFIINNVSVK